jgi:hypothetical protein
METPKPVRELTNVVACMGELVVMYAQEKLRGDYTMTASSQQG